MELKRLLEAETAGGRNCWTEENKQFRPVYEDGFDTTGGKFQALVYDILPSTTAIFSYAMGPENCQQFFVGAQTAVSFLQTTQITSDVCFITDHVAYAISNKTQIV